MAPFSLMHTHTHMQYDEMEWYLRDGPTKMRMERKKMKENEMDEMNQCKCVCVCGCLRGDPDFTAQEAQKSVA